MRTWTSEAVPKQLQSLFAKLLVFDSITSKFIFCFFLFVTQHGPSGVLKTKTNFKCVYAEGALFFCGSQKLCCSTVSLHSPTLTGGIRWFSSWLSILGLCVGSFWSLACKLLTLWLYFKSFNYFEQSSLWHYSEDSYETILYSFNKWKPNNAYLKQLAHTSPG